MEDALPCPRCCNDSQTGVDWDDDGKIIWNCECGLDGNGASSRDEAIKLWNEMVKKYEE